MMNCNRKASFLLEISENILLILSKLLFFCIKIRLCMEVLMCFRCLSILDSASWNTLWLSVQEESNTAQNTIFKGLLSLFLKWLMVSYLWLFKLRLCTKNRKCTRMIRLGIEYSSIWSKDCPSKKAILNTRSWMILFECFLNGKMGVDWLQVPVSIILSWWRRRSNDFLYIFDDKEISW